MPSYSSLQDIPRSISRTRSQNITSSPRNVARGCVFDLELATKSIRRPTGCILISSQLSLMIFKYILIHVPWATARWVQVSSYLLPPPVVLHAPPSKSLDPHQSSTDPGIWSRPSHSPYIPSNSPRRWCVAGSAYDRGYPTLCSHSGEVDIAQGASMPARTPRGMPGSRSGQLPRGT